MIRISPYRDEHFAGVQSLWTEVFPNDPPWNRAEVAIPEKLAAQPDLLLVAENDEGRVVGTAMAGYDGHRGWLYSLAVKPSHQRRGLGSSLVAAAESALAALGCHKLNLQIRAGNEAVSAFYKQHGYDFSDCISMGKRIGIDQVGKSNDESP